jgi:hypothetical protein
MNTLASEDLSMTQKEAKLKLKKYFGKHGIWGIGIGKGNTLNVRFSGNLPEKIKNEIEAAVKPYSVTYHRGSMPTMLART